MNKTILGVIIVSTIAFLVVSSVAVLGIEDLTDEEKGEFNKEKPAIREAIENNDYTTWEALMQEKIARMEDKITEENFQEIRERHFEMDECGQELKQAIEDGDEEAIEELKDKCGFRKVKWRTFILGFKQGFKTGRNSCIFADSE